MARSVVVNWKGEVSSFGLTRVNREKLYGRKVKMVVDESGEPCVAAMLTRDGTALLPPGSTSSMYINDHGEVVDRKELVRTDADGNPLDAVDSTLGNEQELEGPVDASELLEHEISAVYELAPDEVNADLLKELESGGVFKTVFAYRSGYNSSPCFLLANDAGVFALVGDPVIFPFVRPAESGAQFDDDGDDVFDEDDLDFGMM